MKLYLLPIAVVLSGCVGVLVPRDGQKQSTLGECAPSSNIGHIEVPANPRTASKEQFLEKWGRPISDVGTSDGDVLSYNNGMKWRGVFLFPIPIPLLIPTGMNRTTVVFKSNVCESANEEYNEISSYKCGWIFSNTRSDIGCESE